MKKVEAIIRPHRVEHLHETLLESGFSGLTVSEVRGYGRQKGHKEVYPVLNTILNLFRR